MELQSPLILILLTLLLPAVWLMLSRKRQSSIKYSYISPLQTAAKDYKGLKYYGKYFLILCRLLCIAMLIIAIARPQKGKKVSLSSTKGVVMQIVLDRSSSMGEMMNYYGNALSRIDTAKAVLKDFIDGGNGLEGRPTDLIGLISFAQFADTNCPLVQSPEILTDFLSEIQLAQTRNEDGTAISDAIALAAARLNKAEVEIEERNNRLANIAKKDDKEAQVEFEISSKIIILLTDGVQNSGDYTPQEAVDLAKKWGIKIYTIGIGGEPPSSNSFFDMMRRSGLDEKILKWFASETGGLYSRADSAEELEDMCKKINDLEKSEIQSISYNEYDEKYHLYAYIAGGLLLLEILLSSTVFRRMT